MEEMFLCLNLSLSCLLIMYKKMRLYWKNRKMLNIHMFSKVEELMSCQEPLQMLMLPENVQPGFQIFL